MHPQKFKTDNRKKEQWEKSIWGNDWKFSRLEKLVLWLKIHTKGLAE